MKKKENNKINVKETRQVNKKLFAIIYLLCSFCCLVSGIIDYNFANKNVYIIDFILFIAWLVMGIIYFRKGFLNKK